MDFEQLRQNARSFNHEYVQSLKVLQSNLEHELSVLVFHREIVQEHREYLKSLERELGVLRGQMLGMPSSYYKWKHDMLVHAVSEAIERLREMEDNFNREKEKFLKRLPTLD